jgi:hypothetical protein
MGEYGVFPFGKNVKPVVQIDRSPKSVFILGVYASAVHARWIDSKGRTRVAALTVSSEPEIFWRGEGAEKIIRQISIPGHLGQLIPAAPRLNGPSGRSLDENYLSPLGLDRSDAWLCDIYPYAHMNRRQQAAIEREYLPLLEAYNLPKPTLKPAPTRDPGAKRREEIWDEFLESRAEFLVLLGDKPIGWFFKHLEPGYKRLSDFGKDAERYGQIHPFVIRGRELKVIPLVHPRQASRLGASSSVWAKLHQGWKADMAGGKIWKDV